MRKRGGEYGLGLFGIGMWRDGYIDVRGQMYRCEETDI